MGDPCVVRALPPSSSSRPSSPCLTAGWPLRQVFVGNLSWDVDWKILVHHRTAPNQQPSI